MDQIEYQEEMKKTDMGDIEVVKLQSVFDRANIFLFKAGLKMVDGMTDNFVKGVTLVELILRPKLKKKYFETIDDYRKKLAEDGCEDPPFELALFKYGELNEFLDRQVAMPVHTQLG